MSRCLQLTLLLVLVVSACSGAPVQEKANRPVLPEVPPEYQEEFLSLNNIIESYHKHALPNFDTKHAKTHTRLGIIFFEIGRFEEARTNLERAINMHSKMAEAHFYLGRLLKETGRPHEALKEYDQALKIDPDLVEVHKYKGDTYKVLRMEKEADMEYQAYRTASPELPSDPSSQP